MSKSGINFSGLKKFEKSIKNLDTEQVFLDGLKRAHNEFECVNCDKKFEVHSPQFECPQCHTTYDYKIKKN
ncbi:hypothetical protein [Companilactobacillus furfuricola]|uniref:hypothetical protein n=1 Tax=Companilactobacillus furfuricola TaxID=1462575 RepID=UPI0013DDEB8C|nr:hypothetical protein [Companilactobacillus furfuricola]